MICQPAGRWRRALVPGLLFLAGAALRVGSYLVPEPINPDQVRYLVVAHHWRTGGGYADWRGPETHIHPLHPLLTALGGTSLSTLEARGRIVNCLASILLLIPLAFLGHRLAGSGGAWVALALAAFHPRLVLSSSWVQPEALYDLSVACGLLLLLGAARARHQAWRWAGAGMLFGLAYLTRPEGLLVGLLAAAILCVQTLHRGTTLWRSPLLFAGALLLMASPFLLFIRQIHGEWLITGKTAELFFLGQALHANQGQPFEASAYLELMRHWGGILPYLRANPGVVAATIASNAWRIFGWILPRLLGPAGVTGLVAFLVWGRRDPERAPTALLLGAPVLVLFLMTLTFPNERVALSCIPFLLVLAAGGFAVIGARLAAESGRRRIVAVASLLALILLGWGGSLSQAVHAPGRVPPEARAAQMALGQGAEPGRIATNSSVIAFYLADADLFGAPGSFKPFPSDGRCEELIRNLEARGASLVVLDRPDNADSGAPFPTPGCPIRLVSKILDPEHSREILILAGESPTP